MSRHQYLLLQSLFSLLLLLLDSSSADVGTAAFYGPPYLRKWFLLSFLCHCTKTPKLYCSLDSCFIPWVFCCSDGVLWQWRDPVPTGRHVYCSGRRRLGQRGFMWEDVRGEMPELCSARSVQWWGDDTSQGRGPCIHAKLDAIQERHDAGTLCSCVSDDCWQISWGDQHRIYTVSTFL